MMKNDEQIQRDIQAELSSDPRINHARIGVKVDHGAASLSGEVDTYAEKWAAESAARRIGGVCSVTPALAVRVLADHRHDDAEITGYVQSALKWDVFVPKTITARVEQGAVTLEGHATWNFQRSAAERAIRHLVGVVAVHDEVKLTPPASSEQVQEKVAAALRRQADADTNTIHVDTWGGKVTLTGHASSRRSIEDAQSAAWATPGVTEVVDQVRLSTAPGA